MSHLKGRNFLTRLRLATALPLTMAALMTGGNSSAVAGDNGFEVLYSFSSQHGGADPIDSVVRDSAGNLYGMTFTDVSVSSPGDVFRLGPGGAETVLHHFTNGIDGGYPEYDPVLDQAGNLYGTALAGGVYGYGVVFKLTREGTETVIHSFWDESPRSGVMRDNKGNFYGTAAGDCCGLVYKLAPDGTETVLYTFKGGADGNGPAFSGGLAEDTAGNLYGTTVGGGVYGEGVVFKIAPDGAEIVLHSFGAGKDGKLPTGGVIEDQEGNLYGTTYMGGDTCTASAGCGTVFKVAPDGTESVLYSFCTLANCFDGAFPESNLAEDTAGNLYGTTTEYGAVACYEFCGTVFKFTPATGETVLHSFSGGGDGGLPNDLSADENGNLYGTAQSGGAFGAGTVFKLQE